MEEENKLIEERREKLKALRAGGGNAGIAFPNDFRRKDLAAGLHGKFGAKTKEELEPLKIGATVAGRMVLKRVMGKASFATLQDQSGRIQLYISDDAITKEKHQEFKHWDLGDIVGASGTLFKTKTGELTIQASSLRLLAKSLRPLPEKFHGIADQELKYRQRYVDLIVSPKTREVFEKRMKIIQALRAAMGEDGYLEVETPMMQPIPGGAVARPFKTHHHALDMDMFLRIAPELYLKRLVVGGMERVFEINRNFRNEGISTRHNPEFTMMEWYCAYEDCEYMMAHTEKLVRHAAHAVSFQSDALDFEKPFARLPIPEAIRRQGIERGPEGSVTSLTETEGMRRRAQRFPRAGAPCSSCCSKQSQRSTSSSRPSSPSTPPRSRRSRAATTRTRTSSTASNCSSTPRKSPTASPS